MAGGNGEVTKSLPRENSHDMLDNRAAIDRGQGFRLILCAQSLALATGEDDGPDCICRHGLAPT